MWLNKMKGSGSVWKVMLLTVIIVFGVITYQRTKIWKDSGTLWNDVIKQYKEAAVPRSNRAHYLSELAEKTTDGTKKDALYQQAIDDCTVALRGDPDLYIAYKTRGLDLLQLNRYEEALADADSLIFLTTENDPNHSLGYSMRGTAEMNLRQYDKALEDFNKRLTYDPGDDGVLNKRGATLYNGFHKYPEALVDFNKAIEINPKGSYYLNRSRCHYLLGNIDKAKTDAQLAVQKGTAISAEYRKLLNL